MGKNREICHIAKYTLVDMLETKQPDMFSKHMIECIYYMNKFIEDPEHNKFGRNEHICYQPKYNLNQRMLLYKFMITHMSDVEKFNLQEKLAIEILARIYNRTEESGFKEPYFPLSTSALNIITDVLLLLISEEIQLEMTKNLRSDLADADTAMLENDEAVTASQMAAGSRSTFGPKNIKTAKLKLQIGGISQIQKTLAVERILPAVLCIMRLLEKGDHVDIFKHAISYLSKFKQNNKKELDELLKSDSQQKAELEHMIKRMEKMEARKKRLAEVNRAMEAANVGVVPKTPKIVKSRNSEPISTGMEDDSEDKENQPASKIIKREQGVF